MSDPTFENPFKDDEREDLLIIIERAMEEYPPADCFPSSPCSQWQTRLKYLHDLIKGEIS